MAKIDPYPAPSKILDPSGATLTDSANNFIAHVRALGGTGSDKIRPLPPVHLWHPSHCGDIGLEIRYDGSWWHEGVRMTRFELVRLFSTILRRDSDGQYYLVTPVEKVIIRVEDVPFVIVRLDIDESRESGNVRDRNIALTTNMGDVVILGPAHKLRMQVVPQTGESVPYVLIRDGLEARVNRACFYQLVDLCEEIDTENGPRLAVWSDATCHELGAFA